MGAYLERLKKINLSLPPTDKTDQADKTSMSAESVAHEKVESPLSAADKTDKSRLKDPFVGSVSFVSSREGEKFLQVAPSTPNPSVSFVSASLRESVDFSPPETAALAILRELYQQHRQRLVDGGHSPQGARVRGDTYRAALLARAIPLEAAIALRQAKRVRAEGLYWHLVEEVTP